MSAHKSDRELVREVHNTARYFTERRHVSWVLLVGTIFWGVLGYIAMPKAKDPVIPVRIAAAMVVWPTAKAENIEQLITKKLEAKIAENPHVDKIESTTRSSVSFVLIYLKEDVKDVPGILDDINLKLNSINDLPLGSSPVIFLKDFGEAAALLLTVASPRVGDIELELRARTIKKSIDGIRSKVTSEGSRATIVSCFPIGVHIQSFRRAAASIGPLLEQRGIASDFRFVSGPGFLAVDLASDATDDALRTAVEELLTTHLRVSEFHPDVWPLTIVRNSEDTLARITEVAGDKYGYRELDDFTERIQKRLRAIPRVSSVSRAGVLPEQVYLEYSQERLASYGVRIDALDKLIAARNISLPGGVMEIGTKNLVINPSGQLSNEQELGDILVAVSEGGAPLYLRDIVDIQRAYESPPRYLNFITRIGADGRPHRSRAVTVAVQMRKGEQIADFGRDVSDALSEVRTLLPDDLILERVSDQPLQVEENVGLFMRSLYEAIILVVIVALIGFWEWRSALLMALSIPITLAMTFGFMVLAGLDIQQVSIASLIIALGLLVDDPVVAGDAIKRSLNEGWKSLIAAWLGPTKLATAILFATITNIVAYLPFLILSGDTGRFIFTLPVVLALSLIASRLVSMTFIPLLGYYLLRPDKKQPASRSEARSVGFAKYYTRFATWAIENRLLVVFVSIIPLIGAFALGSTLRQSFFPKDRSYLSYVDVWLPEDAPLAATGDTALQVEQIIHQVVADYAKETGGEDGPRDVLDSLTTFIGGGSPRFWFSVIPEQSQLNYAQIIIKVKDKHDTPIIVPKIQAALHIPGAGVDVRELENGKPVGIPVQVRISGDDPRKLRELAQEVKAVFQKSKVADRVRDDWGAESFQVELRVDSDRANLAGITNFDVAASSAVGMNGMPVGALREDGRIIPIVARLRAEERAQLADIQNLYVYSSRGSQKVPLRQVSAIAYSLETEKIKRRNQYRTITVAAFPVEGALPSEVMADVDRWLKLLQKKAPPGYKIEVGGEQEEQQKGFLELAVVLLLSTALIFMALVIQFKNAIKPLIVFAAIPYGMAGAMVTLWISGEPFGFMAFLGVVSLIGVIVSHVIVLFDFIEEAHEHGESLHDALLDAAIVRLRPVVVTVGATVLGLVPLAHSGGPLWRPLCYAQIGGLTIATVVTLILVPVLYAIFVEDLKWIAWDPEPPSDDKLPAGQAIEAAETIVGPRR